MFFTPGFFFVWSSGGLEGERAARARRRSRDMGGRSVVSIFWLESFEVKVQWNVFYFNFGLGGGPKCFGTLR